MAKDPDKPSPRSLLTGTAQSVTNSVERAREHFKGHPEPGAPASKARKNFRTRKTEPDVAEEPAGEPEDNKPERNGEEDSAED